MTYSVLKVPLNPNQPTNRKTASQLLCSECRASVQACNMSIYYCALLSHAAACHWPAISSTSIANTLGCDVIVSVVICVTLLVKTCCLRYVLALGAVQSASD